MNTYSTYAGMARQAAAVTRRALGALAMLGIFLAAVPHASARDLGQIRIEVPFAFVVGQTTMPAGEYQIVNATTNVLTLRRTDGSAAAMISAARIDAARTIHRSELVFNRYGDDYYLSEVRPSESPLAYRLRMSKQEVRLAKAISSPEVVAVAAARR
jgi:hypothetical protein